jgi:hypothetical protein
MSQSPRLAATNDVLIITTSSVRGDEPTVEFTAPSEELLDGNPSFDEGWTLDYDEHGRRYLPIAR